MLYTMFVIVLFCFCFILFSCFFFCFREGFVRLCWAEFVMTSRKYFLDVSLLNLLSRFRYFPFCFILFVISSDCTRSGYVYKAWNKEIILDWIVSPVLESVHVWKLSKLDNFCFFIVWCQTGRQNFRVRTADWSWGRFSVFCNTLRYALMKCRFFTAISDWKYWEIKEWVEPGGNWKSTIDYNRN